MVIGPDDSLARGIVDALAAAGLTEEHRLYPAVLQWFAEGRVTIANGIATVHAGAGSWHEFVAAEALDSAPSTILTSDPDGLVRLIDGDPAGARVVGFAVWRGQSTRYS